MLFWNCHFYLTIYSRMIIIYLKDVLKYLPQDLGCIGCLCMIIHVYIYIYISGWWFQPLWQILVSWDYYSQYMESHKSHVPNHQPDTEPPRVVTSSHLLRGTLKIPPARNVAHVRLTPGSLVPPVFITKLLICTPSMVWFTKNNITKTLRAANSKHGQSYPAKNGCLA